MDEIKTNRDRERSDSFIATIFFVTAGVLAPWAVSEIALRLYIAGAGFFDNAGLGGGLGIIATILAIYMTAYYVARYVKSRYMVRSIRRTALISALYFTFLIPLYMYDYYSEMRELGLNDFVLALVGFRFIALSLFAYTIYYSVNKHLSSLDA